MSQVIKIAWYVWEITINLVILELRQKEKKHCVKKPGEGRQITSSMPALEIYC